MMVFKVIFINFIGEKCLDTDTKRFLFPFSRGIYSKVLVWLVSHLKCLIFDKIASRLIYA